MKKHLMSSIAVVAVMAFAGSAYAQDTSTAASAATEQGEGDQSTTNDNGSANNGSSATTVGDIAVEDVGNSNNAEGGDDSNVANGASTVNDTELTLGDITLENVGNTDNSKGGENSNVADNASTVNDNDTELTIGDIQLNLTTLSSSVSGIEINELPLASGEGSADVRTGDITGSSVENARGVFISNNNTGVGSFVNSQSFNVNNATVE